MGNNWCLSQAHTALPLADPHTHPRMLVSAPLRFPVSSAVIGMRFSDCSCQLVLILVGEEVAESAYRHDRVVRVGVHEDFGGFHEVLTQVDVTNRAVNTGCICSSCEDDSGPAPKPRIQSPPDFAGCLFGVFWWEDGNAGGGVALAEGTVRSLFREPALADGDELAGDDDDVTLGDAGAQIGPHERVECRGDEGGDVIFHRCLGYAGNGDHEQ